MFDEMRQGQAEKELTAALTGTFRDLWPQLQRKYQLDDMRLRTAVRIGLCPIHCRSRSATGRLHRRCKGCSRGVSCAGS